MEVSGPTPPRRARRIARWLPLAGLLVVLVPIVGAVLAGGLPRVVGWYVLPFAGPPLGAAVGLGTAVYATWKTRWRSRAVQATLAASVLALLPVVVATGGMQYPATLEATQPAATVRLPADGPIAVLWGGDELATNYHAYAPDQRWAYDLAMEPLFVQSDRLEDYGCYGRPVLAPAPGTVTVARDGAPDQPPGEMAPPLADPTGNHVALRLDETGTFLVIAHLAPGSVAVEVGQTVAEGDTLGRCGNSGNTSEPHIHIHHQRQDPANVPLAEGLPLYFRDHDGPPMPTGGIEVRDGRNVSTGMTVRHTPTSVAASTRATP